MSGSNHLIVNIARHGTTSARPICIIMEINIYLALSIKLVANLSLSNARSDKDQRPALCDSSSRTNVLLYFYFILLSRTNVLFHFLQLATTARLCDLRHLSVWPCNWIDTVTQWLKVAICYCANIPLGLTIMPLLWLRLSSIPINRDLSPCEYWPSNIMASRRACRLGYSFISI
jgi:hypothetical protein